LAKILLIKLQENLFIENALYKVITQGSSFGINSTDEIYLVVDGTYFPNDICLEENIQKDILSWEKLKLV
jgi:hypothetical protein